MLYALYFTANEWERMSENMNERMSVRVHLEFFIYIEIRSDINPVYYYYYYSQTVYNYKCNDSTAIFKLLP